MNPGRFMASSLPLSPHPHQCQAAHPTRAGQAAWQLQFGPQVQASPHRQVARAAVSVFWQPQVQDEPGQEEQVQVLCLADMTNSSRGWWTAVLTTTVYHSGRGTD